MIVSIRLSIFLNLYVLVQPLLVAWFMTTIM